MLFSIQFYSCSSDMKCGYYIKSNSLISLSFISSGYWCLWSTVCVFLMKERHVSVWPQRCYLAFGSLLFTLAFWLVKLFKTQLELSIAILESRTTFLFLQEDRSSSSSSSFSSSSSLSTSLRSSLSSWSRDGQSQIG